MYRPDNIAIAGISCFLLWGLFFGTKDAQGFPESHGPFTVVQDNTVPLNICKPVQRNLVNVHPALGSVTFSAPDGRTLKLNIETQADPYAEKYFVQISAGEKDITSRIEVPLVATVVYLLPSEAICKDLNGDGITDFITTHSLHGNGLGASFYDRLVMLSSSPAGYRFWLVRTMDPTQNDFQLIGDPKSMVMLTTSFANSGGAVPHSYYVYDLWRFLGDELVLSNELDTRFAKWVWMTFSENHKTAASLSNDDKLRMLPPRTAQEVTFP